MIDCKVLVLDDDTDFLLYLQLCLEYGGYQTIITATAAEALQKLQEERVDVVVSDVWMPGISGLDMLKIIKEKYPQLPVIMMTAYNATENIVEAIKAGAYDYITKPFAKETLLSKLESIRQNRLQEEEKFRLRNQLRFEYSFGNIVGTSKAMLSVLEKIKLVAGNNAPVLIQGLAGTEKELIAKTMHYNSDRKHRPFTKINCAMDEAESLIGELCGYDVSAIRRGDSAKPGKLELANGGTIFLDDLDEMPLAAQPIVACFLRTKRFQRVGGEIVSEADVRIMGGSKQSLNKITVQKEFDAELAGCFSHQIILPALIERREDIPMLIRHFVQKHDRTVKINPNKIPDAILAFAMSYSWPGNLQELEQMIANAVVLCQEEELKAQHFHDYLMLESIANTSLPISLPSEGVLDFNQTMQKVEKQLLQWAWNKTGGHQKRMSQLLNIPLSTLRDKLIKHKFLIG